MAIDLLWALGVELSANDPPQVHAFALDENDRIRRAKVPFAEAIGSPPLAWHAQLGRIETKHMRFRDVRLTTGTARSTTSNLLRRTLGLIGATDGHKIYGLHTDSGTLWVPALTLVRALFGSNSFLIERLLHYGSLARLSRPGTRSSEGTLDLELSAWPAGARLSDDCARTLAWLVTDRTARYAWDSVYYHAWSEGGIDLDLPDVLLEGWARGIEDRDGLLVTDLRGLRVTFPGAISEVRVRRGATLIRVAGRGDEESVFSFGTRTNGRSKPAVFSIESYLGI